MGGVFAKLIEQHKHPSEVFSTAADNQPSVKSRFTSELTMAKDNRMLACIPVGQHSQAPHGQIEVTLVSTPTV